jgi:hypothetical protein
MKNVFRAVFAVSILSVVSCAAGKQLAKSAIDIALALCIAEHPDASMPALKDLCHYADELAPVVQDLIAAQKKAAAAKPGACGPTVAVDAGVPMPVKDGGK